jgi:CheY-like chemotaxis protein
VLLVDDQEINIKVLARALSNLGVLPLNVRTARNGMEALAAYEALGPDFDGVVFMDHEMPLLSGSEAALELRRRGFVGAIVGVTGNASEKSRRSFMKAGIDEILVKPFKAEQLGEVLGEWVGIEEQAV